MINKIPIMAVVLSAGKSTRMGKLKQLLPIHGVSMLETVLRNILSFPFSKIISVLGYKNQEIRESIFIEDPRFNWITNDYFDDGLSTSIKKAVEHVHTEMQGMMIFLGDQPMLDKKTILQLLHTIEKNDQTSKLIIQPIYKGQTGHPVFISSGMFPYIRQLSGDQGAKKIFPFTEKHILVPVDDRGVIVDVDTPDHYEYIIKSLEPS
jgi:molybdenum cofactor cytidylyltransferase